MWRRLRKVLVDAIASLEGATGSTLIAAASRR
jgi:hypothetical protein